MENLIPAKDGEELSEAIVIKQIKQQPTFTICKSPTRKDNQATAYISITATISYREPTATPLVVKKILMS